MTALRIGDAADFPFAQHYRKAATVVQEPEVRAEPAGLAGVRQRTVGDDDIGSFASRGQSALTHEVTASRHQELPFTPPSLQCDDAEIA